ncbi:hypothetical protein CBR_g16163 [Chara braunii]|uniref:DUF659 domain-containing protein n=1 Tax=Chara braunii TaxID=69332 RepID=A0A388KTX6_CHABU|nr:hypothetical protein CBR_g16163 [Chara braunii]|eukprot:GBG73448.1 hypothetical protein CBR_g16163 [Chara braunii]
MLEVSERVQGPLLKVQVWFRACDPLVGRGGEGEEDGGYSNGDDAGGIPCRREGSAGAGPSSAPSRSSLVAQSPTASRPPVPAVGESTTPTTSRNAAPLVGRPTRQTLIEEADNIITRNEQTSRHLDCFLICTNQPFSLIENHYFLQLIDAVKKSHPSWWSCKRDEMRTKRLDGQHKIVGDEMKSLVRRWERTGCTLQMDGWSDRRNKPHLNVMVSSPIGTVFWKSVCMEGKDKDSAAYFKLLEGVIEEVGPRSIVGVVMDNARVCAKAEKMVEAKYPGIFSVGCKAHALDLALEDMYKRLDWIKEVVDKGNRVGKFVTNIDKVRAMFNRIANAQLKRPAVTRFATNFEMLESLKRGRTPLELCVGNVAWVDKLVRPDQVVAFNAVTRIIVDSEGFWDEVDKAIAVMEPVVKLLRLVDGPGATVGKVYFGMDEIVARMRVLDCLTQDEKVVVENILMDRWAFMTSELHCAAAFLDPEYRSQTLRDTEIREGFNIWLYSWAPTELLREISKQVDTWVCGEGTLGTLNAKEQAKVQTPALWWEAFGGSLDLLQPQAIKLLGQVSSSAACERTWSLHQLIYGQRRTKLLPERLAKLVYSNWNIQLTTQRGRGETEDNHIPWKDNKLAKMEVEEWYEDRTRQVIEGRAADATAAEVADDDDGDGPLVRTWQKNDEEDDLEEDDIALLGSVQRTWHANTKSGKHRVRELRRKSGLQEPEPSFLYTLKGRDRAMSARQAGDWVHGREEASGRRQRKRKAATPEPDEARPTRKGKSKEGGDEVAPPKRKRGRPPLSPAKKAAAKAAKKAAEDEAAAAKAAKASSAAEARPKRKGMEDDDDNLCGQAEVQSSESTSSSSEESGKSRGRRQSRAAISTIKVLFTLLRVFQRPDF